MIMIDYLECLDNKNCYQVFHTKACYIYHRISNMLSPAFTQANKPFDIKDLQNNVSS